MAVPALAVANYFLDLAERDGQTIDPMGIQKLVYFAHGWNLAISGDALINEPVEAWPYGPVIESVYDAFKQDGRGPITEKASHGTTLLARRPYDLPDSNKPLVEKVWTVYRGYSSSVLANKTHEAGSPWRHIWTSGGQVKGAEIPDEYIQEHYKGLLDQNRARQHSQ